VNELRAAGEAYPEDVRRNYLQLPRNMPRRVIDEAHGVAGGAASSFDKAVAIESFLRDNFTYSTHVASVPPDRDWVDYFLFDSKQGYCDYFATTMVVLLRAEGVPARVASGFAPGEFDPATGISTVRENHAHSWVEVYFPRYGWITFEPTPDPNYPTIQRGAASGGSPDTSGAATVVPTPAAASTKRSDRNAASPATGRRLELPPLRTWTPVGAVLLLLGVLLYVAASRYLRPQSVAGVWSRAMRLTWLAGVRSEVGDTPIEFGDRVACEFPEAAAGMRQLAVDFAVAAYAPPGLAELRKPAVMAGWAALRPLLLRRVASRLVPERFAQARQASTASPV